MDNVMLTAGVDIATDRVEISIEDWALSHARPSFRLICPSSAPWIEEILTALDSDADRLVFKPRRLDNRELVHEFGRRVGKTWAREAANAARETDEKAPVAASLRGRLLTSSAVLAGA